MKFKHMGRGYYVRNYQSEHVSDAVACIMILCVFLALGWMSLAIIG